MKVDSYKCDQCATQKREVNHWFKGYTLPNNAGLVIVQWDVTRAVIDGDSLVLDLDKAAHLCGASCVTEWLSKNLL